jgi:ribosomal protein L37AE/L43A
MERAKMQLGQKEHYGMELKYCERCGTLGLRRGGSGQVYCNHCEQAMSQAYRAPLRKREPTPSPSGEQEERGRPVTPGMHFNGESERCL